MSKEKTLAVGRLAFRVEGHYWNCYLVPIQGEEGKVQLGSIAFAAAKEKPEIKDGFMELMQTALSVMSQKVFGGEGIPEFRVEKAPEHERSGNA